MQKQLDAETSTLRDVFVPNLKVSMVITLIEQVICEEGCAKRIVGNLVP